MAQNSWLARALRVAQVERIEIDDGPVVAGELFTVTINGKDIKFTATTTTLAHVITGLLALLQDEQSTEFTEITWASPSSTIITGTAVTAGKPFTATVSTNSVLATIARSTTTAATGPNHWDDANNWSLGAIPANTNDVDVDLARGSVLYGLGQSSITLASLDVYSSGQTQNTMGLAELDEDGLYVQYRTKDLQIGATLCRIRTRSPRVRIDFGGVQTATEVRETGDPDGEGVPAVLLKGSNASNVFEMKRGTTGLGYYLGESVVAATVRVAPEATLFVGESPTFATIVSLGNTLMQGGATTLTVEGGETRVIGSGAFTTFNAEGGTLFYESSGTVTNANIGPGTVDCSGDISPRIFSNTTIDIGGRLVDPNQTITHTAGILRTTRVQEVAAA